MSTRAVIAIPDGDGWRGRYHHWDGYPSGLGVTLVNALVKYFDGDLEAMITKLVEDEHVGWSTINGADLHLPPEWSDSVDERSGPQSYSCRGENAGLDSWITDRDWDCWCVWAYVLTPCGVLVAKRSSAGAIHPTMLEGSRWTPVKLVAWGDVETMEGVH